MGSPTLAPGLESINLWMAFRPGEHMYMNIKATHRVVKLRSMERCECSEAGSGGSRWEVEFEYIVDNGTQLGLVEGQTSINPYDGYRALEKLRIFPLSYHPKKDSIIANLIARGRKMLDLRGVHYLMYERETESLSDKRLNTSMGERDIFPLQSRAVSSSIRLLIPFLTICR